VPLALLEPRGRVLAVNRQWTQLLGYTLAEVPDIPTWVELAYPDQTYRAMALSLWEQALSAVMDQGREMQPTEVQVRCKDGQMRNVLVGGAMVGKELMTSFVDVTLQRRAQAELEALNASLEAACKSGPRPCNRPSITCSARRKSWCAPKNWPASGPWWPGWPTNSTPPSAMP